MFLEAAANFLFETELFQLSGLSPKKMFLMEIQTLGACILKSRKVLSSPPGHFLLFATLLLARWPLAPLC